MYILQNQDNLVTIIYDGNYLPDNTPYLEVDELPVQLNPDTILKVDIENNKLWWDDSGVDLDAVKQEKIIESKLKLKAFLINNPLYSNVHNNTYDYYTVTEDKQTLLMSEFMSYQFLKQSGIDTTFTWNAAGKECEVWTEAEGISLINQIRSYVKPLVSKQQDLEIRIKACNSAFEVNNIIIEYGEVITEGVIIA